MGEYIIPDGNGGFINFFCLDDVEYVNPIEYYRINTLELIKKADKKKFLNLDNPGFSQNLIEAYFNKKAIDEWLMKFTKSSAIP